ncbi:hypothetical protein GCM10009789_16930 [Kribbella sancticallisti]|uniref:DUF4352 domain-containing protein n=1 Tax=Kribbella sancticallisti TaxID=460087 RepID=A0ABN2CUV9_9ACTN
MESLDDVIDAMIADRVIHRHRRKWVIALALVVVAALIILATGGWKEKKGRTVETLTAPVTVEAGRYEFGFSTAEIIRRPKTSTQPAETRVELKMEVKNIDSEEQESDSLQGKFLVLVPGGGQDPIESNGATCRGELNYVFVYGLPAETCTAKFEVPADFTGETLEFGVLGEKYESDNGLLGASEKPYWHLEEPTAVVRVPATTVTETK